MPPRKDKTTEVRPAPPRKESRARPGPPRHPTCPRPMTQWRTVSRETCAGTLSRILCPVYGATPPTLVKGGTIVASHPAQWSKTLFPTSKQKNGSPYSFFLEPTKKILIRFPKTLPISFLEIKPLRAPYLTTVYNI